MKTFTPRLLPLMLCTAALLSACGGSDNDDDNTEAPEKPGAPSVTSTVSTKSLSLDWNSVSGATYYRVNHNADGSSGYTDISGQLSATEFSTTLAVHLSDWEDGRYMVEACNNAGCTAGADVFISDEMLNAIGYIKASEPVKDALFGFGLAVSGDGKTLAIGAPQQDFDADADPATTGDIAIRAGAIYLYSAASTGWVLQETINNPAEDHGQWDLFGYSLSLSEDGTLLAVGAPFNDSDSREIDSDEQSNAGRYNGAAYIYALNDLGDWEKQSFLKSSNSDDEDYFGMRVVLTPDGSRLAVSAPYEASNASGIDGNQDDNSIERAGAVYIFDFDGASWSQTAYIKPSTPSHLESFCFDPRPPGDPACYEKSPSLFGFGLALANDGMRLAVGAPGDSSLSSGINGAEDYYRGKSSGAVHIIDWIDDSWQHTAYLKASNPDIDDQFGYAIALSEDGNSLAVGAPYEDSATAEDASNNSESDAGAAYVFQYTDSAWQQVNLLKAGTPDEDNLFGWSVALAGNGDYLAVGAPRDSSDGEGISDEWDNNGAPSAGAAYVYQSGDSGWTHTSYVKASNTDPNDTFGRSLALSANGDTLAVAATGEDSSSPGVDGDLSSSDSSNSGAVYLY